MVWNAMAADGFLGRRDQQVTQFHSASSRRPLSVNQSTIFSPATKRDPRSIEQQFGALTMQEKTPLLRLWTLTDTGTKTLPQGSRVTRPLPVRSFVVTRATSPPRPSWRGRERMVASQGVVHIVPALFTGRTGTVPSYCQLHIEMRCSIHTRPSLKVVRESVRLPWLIGGCSPFRWRIRRGGLEGSVRQGLVLRRG